MSDTAGTPPLAPLVTGAVAAAALARDGMAAAADGGPPQLRAVDRSALGSWHSLYGGQRWRVDPKGVYVDGREQPERSRGEPASMRLYLALWGDYLREAAWEEGVPLTLLLMTLGTENGSAKVEGQSIQYAPFRKEPGYTSDQAPPHRISVGPCHLLISTARAALGRPRLTRQDLLDPALNIRGAAAYIAGQYERTGFDPILVAAAYNAGGVYDSSSSSNPKFRNPWNLRSWDEDGKGPLPGHLDRAAAWYGDAVEVLSEAGRCVALDGTGLGRVVV